MNETVTYEGSLLPSDGSGNTVYDPGFPIPPVMFHGTDMAHPSPIAETNTVAWSDLDYEIGGDMGLVDRNAFTNNGIANYTDAHDFRGDHVPVPIRGAGGGYGDVGWDDYSNQYANAVAAQGYPDTTREESWADLSAGI